ncbi:hypothetical protein Tco_0495832 [Tanacetum coccineum]
MVVLWNPSVRKCVGIPIPNVYYDSPYGYTRIGFGVCPDTNDPKLVKIDVVVKTPSIFGFIYWPSSGRFLLSFDLKSEKFGEVCIPERLVIPSVMRVVKVNESLGLLEYYKEGGMSVCGVRMRNDGVNKRFTKIYTVKVEGKMMFNSSVLGFRNNGDVVLGIGGDDYKESTVEVYEPSSGHISGVGINGDYLTFSASSYMETLLLLH